jgi:hypothetical protein
MAEQKKTPITIDGVEYIYEDLDQKQRIMVNHLADLDRKVNSTQFNLDQLNVGKDAFIKNFKDYTASLATTETPAG